MSKKKKRNAAKSDAAQPRPATRPGLGPGVAGAAVGVFIVIVALWFWKTSHGIGASSAAASSPTANAASSAHGAAIATKSFPSQGHAHLDPSQPDDFVYNSNPPTSGPHKEIFSDQFVNPSPLPAYVQVHLLEHGNVLLQYSCACPDIASTLSSLAYEYDSKLIAPNELQPSPDEVQAGEESGKAVIVAPYPRMKAKIALTAWTRLATLDAVDKAKIDSFISQYLNNQANASQ